VLTLTIRNINCPHIFYDLSEKITSTTVESIRRRVRDFSVEAEWSSRTLGSPSLQKDVEATMAFSSVATPSSGTF
jgi:hypothetical protein